MLTVAMVGLGLGIGVAPGAAQGADTSAVTAARRFMALLQAGDFTQAEQMVVEEARDKLGATQLTTVWAQMETGLGKLEGLRDRTVTSVNSLRAVELLGDFTNQTVLLRVVVTPTGQVAGFWVGPVPPDVAAPPVPPYADTTKFREEEVKVGAEPWMLPATLTVPASVGPHPVVVLVHGSGPHDRDETVGGAKVFRDLAWGLASRGIAVLRYEKRTKVHGERMGPETTVDEEVVEDAIAAIEVSRAHPSIDGRRAYVLGHSLGAQLAPEIARRSGAVAGAILMAAPARPLGDLMLEQLEYLKGLPQNASPEAQSQIESALVQVRRLVAGEVAADEMVLGAPGSYFIDLSARSGVAEAKALRLPLLVLQGERDYQVTMTDFGLWKNALEGRENATLRAFPGLNHLFVEGSGPSTPAEYAQSAFVSPAVVSTIADWIQGR